MILTSSILCSSRWRHTSSFSSSDLIICFHLFFRVRFSSFHIHSPQLASFLCFIVLFQSYCSHAQLFGRTLVHVWWAAGNKKAMWRIWNRSIGGGANVYGEEWRKGRQMQEDARRDVEDEENWAVVVMWDGSDKAWNKEEVLKSIRVPI